MRDQPFGVGTGLGAPRQVFVDLALADHHLVGDLAFAQAAEDDLLADVFAETVEADAVAGQRIAELLDGEFVVLGDACDGAVELRLVDADAVLLGIAELDALQEDGLEHLLLEDVARRQGDTLPAQLVDCHTDAVLQLESRDDLAVDQRDDAVERNGVSLLAAAGGLVGSPCTRRQRGECDQQQGGEERPESGHWKRASVVRFWS